MELPETLKCLLVVLFYNTSINYDASVTISSGGLVVLFEKFSITGPYLIYLFLKSSLCILLCQSHLMLSSDVTFPSALLNNAS